MFEERDHWAGLSSAVISVSVNIAVERLRLGSTLGTLSFEESALVETVSDEREDEETSEGGQEPDPPGDAGLAWLAGDDGGGDAVGLESQMSLVN